MKNATELYDLETMASLSRDMIKNIDNTTEEISGLNVSLNYTIVKREYLSALSYLRLACVDFVRAYNSGPLAAPDFIYSAADNLDQYTLHRNWVQQMMD
jgi:hypothetical protein